MKKVSKEDLRHSDKQENGCLYIIATPIGNFDDISLRAIKLLKSVEILLCEDTRKTKKLLSHLNINRKNLISYNDNNAENKRPQIISKLLSKTSIGIVSDAGTPLISDPGYKLVKECYINNIRVTHAPGPSSVINGLILSGLPTNQFYFGGFISSKKTLKKKQFIASEKYNMTGIWFDTCLRINNTLAIMQEVFGNRKISIARELTKTYEEIISGDLNDIIKTIDKRKRNNNPLKGEVILIVDGYTEEKFEINNLSVIVKNKLEKLSFRDAVDEITTETKLPRRVIYNEAIKIRNNV
ncbi:MAG: 16S rRNA (cytidine(1402)-2'-O)-methyltransferase [Rhodospirillaceae bacterium]|nr:16S rRNA (cytidine(1402)-2'-O)-methyltransferase [Rhodospirillaceae bacterium]